MKQEKKIQKIMVKNAAGIVCLVLLTLVAAKYTETIYSTVSLEEDKIDETKDIKLSGPYCSNISLTIAVEALPDTGLIM